MCDKQSSRGRNTMQFYTAGKTWHAPKFQHLRDTLGMPVQARWIDLKDDDDIVVNRKGDLWQLCLEDVTRSDFLLLYSEAFEEEQRGALVELGMAFAAGKRVYAIGRCKSIAPNAISDVAFTHHKLFHWLPTQELVEGAAMALDMERRVRIEAARTALNKLMQR
jgi:nucleoside 2-deoxyribosyltransferase